MLRVRIILLEGSGVLARPLKHPVSERDDQGRVLATRMNMAGETVPRTACSQRRSAS